MILSCLFSLYKRGKDLEVDNMSQNGLMSLAGWELFYSKFTVTALDTPENDGSVQLYKSQTQKYSFSKTTYKAAFQEKKKSTVMTAHWQYNKEEFFILTAGVDSDQKANA